jgi:CheY-like chemotaxis protein
MLLASYGYTRRTGDRRASAGRRPRGSRRAREEADPDRRPAGGLREGRVRLGESAPRDIIVIPVLFEEQVLAVIELASFTPFSEIILQFLDQLTRRSASCSPRSRERPDRGAAPAVAVPVAGATGAVEALQRQQMELQATNEELQEKAEQLERQNRDIEIKNREIEMARSSLEEKAEQLALSSKYKSEFLANMSHEQRLVPGEADAGRRHAASTDAAALVRRGAFTGMAVHADEASSAGDEGEIFANVADDDRDAIGSGDRVLLVVENDLAFAKVLLDAARIAGFKGLVSNTGAGALTMAREFHPAVITLDISLPDMQGWRILDRLKTDVATRHIPICVVSTDDSRERALQAGAIGFVAKPLQSKDEVDVAVAQLYGYCDRPFRNLVVALPATPMRAQLLASMDGDVRPILAEDGDAIRAALRDADCVVIDESVSDFGPRT